jgi:hypothetical protein
MISPSAYTKSSYSSADGCVEVRLLSDATIGLRDSKDVAKPPHVFTPREWRAFLDGVRAGEFDLPADLP